MKAYRIRSVRLRQHKTYRRASIQLTTADTNCIGVPDVHLIMYNSGIEFGNKT